VCEIVRMQGYTPPELSDLTTDYVKMDSAGQKTE
jgi:hypothetical protein